MGYPILSESYYTDGGNDEIKKMMSDAYAQALTINQTFWTEADLDLRFKAGDQRLWNDLYGQMPHNMRKNFNFNRIQRVINMISGHQRRNRKSMITVPIEGSDEMTSDQLSKVLFWVTKKDNMLWTISDAFEGAITTGFNLLSVWMDYRNDLLNGEVCVDNVGYNSFLIDPFFRKRDLSDCNYLWRRMWKSKKQLKGLFPERDDDIDNIQPRGNRDGRFSFMPESFNFGSTNLISLDEFWYIDTRKQKIIEDLKTGDSVEYFGDKETLEEFVKADKNRVSKTVMVPTVKVVYCVGGEVFYHGVNPYGHELRPLDRYPFVPMFGYYEPDLSDFPYRVQGVVRGLRDAQYLYNRRKIIELDILESQVNSGWVFEEDALIDPTDVYMTGQGKGIAVKPGRLASVMRIEAPQIPPSMIQLSEQLGNEIMQISGVNEELLGSATDDKAGVLSMLRQGAGLVTLQKLYDNLDYSQKLLGQIVVDMIQANFSAIKVERIINEDVSPQFREKAFQRYDIEVTAGMDTDTQKQMAFLQLLELQAAGLPIAPEDIIDASQLQNKSKLIENMKKRQEAEAQAQQEMNQKQMEVLQAQVEDLRSRSMSHQANALERASRVAENEGLASKNQASAILDIEKAKLDKIKAMKEIDGMNIAQIHQILSIIDTVDMSQSKADLQSIDKANVKADQGIDIIQQEMQKASSSQGQAQGVM